MCKIFAEHQIWQRTENNEFRIERKGNPIDPPFIDYKRQECTITEELLILDDSFSVDDPRHEVARAHCYRKADGTIGASGLPDPKQMTIGNTSYRGIKRRSPHCQLCESGDMIPHAERHHGSTYRP
jgi:hypothetical protein